MSTSNKRWTVLVTDGNSRAALAVTRSLGRAGHTVIVGEKRHPSLAGASRYCAKRVLYPDPARDEAGFLDGLEDVVRRHGVEILVPVADITTWLVSASRTRFEPGCRIPCPAVETIERAADKADVMRTAIRLGIPVPRTVFLEDPAAIARIASEVTFPVVIKPRRSRLRTGRGWLSTSVRYADTREALACDVAGRHELEFPLLLQDRIVGAGVGLFTCIDRGRSLAWFSHRRLREKPPSGGVSVLCESTAVPPATRNHAERLLTELGWRGVAMVEFKEDERDGEPKLMEVNGRFWGSLQLAIDAGLDFPTLLLERLYGGVDGPMPEYRAGVQSRWLWGDVDSLLITMRGGQGSNGRGRGRALACFMKVWGRDLHYENPRLSDLGPWFHETRQWFGRSVD